MMPSYSRRFGSFNLSHERSYDAVQSFCQEQDLSFMHKALRYRIPVQEKPDFLVRNPVPQGNTEMIADGSI